MKLKLYSSLILIFLISPSLSEAAIPIPSTIESGQVEKRLEKTPEPPNDHLTLPGGEAPTPLPPGSEKVIIDVSSLAVDGVTVYDPIDLMARYQNIVGTEVTLADIYRLAAKISKKYRNDGYILAKVSVASWKDGDVRLHVAEGKVSHVRFKNTAFADDEIVNGMVKNIQAIDPFNINQLEREILRLNDLYGVKAKAVLEQGRKPGEVGIELVIEKSDAKQLQTSLSFDNYGSRYMGPFEATVTEQINGLAFAHDNLTMTGFSTVPPDELKLGSLAYTTPINSSGTSLGISGSYGATHAGYNLKSKDITGSFDNIGVNMTQNIIRSREQNLNISAAITDEEANSDLLSQRLYNDRLRTGKLGVTYDNVDTLGGANSLAVSTVQGLDMLGASRTGSADLSRADGHSGFTKFETTLSRTQNIYDDFSGLASFSGQYALNPLLATEQFGYGGQSFGRAYDPSEITGDSGAAGLIELRYGGLPVYESVSSQPYTFYDIGKVWNIHGEDETGASLGAGMRFNYLTAANANFFVAKPLTRGVNDPVSGNQKSLRYLFSISCVF